MKPALLLLLAPVLLSAPAGAVGDATLQANAYGFVDYVVTDARTGATLCDTEAALAVDAGGLGGAAQWTPRECVDHHMGAALFTTSCTDLCTVGCDARETEVRCTSWYSTSMDGWTWEELVLRRDGTVSLTREVYTPTSAVRVEMTGTLTLVTWH